MTRTTSLLLLVSAAWFAVHPDPVQAQISSSEREALVDLYHATGGDDWHDNDGWLSEPGSECDWHGIQCVGSSDERVVLRVMLPDNNLTGQLPASLAGLEGLVTLSLPDNALDGTIPPDLWGLSRLEGLFLHNNRLTGLVPAGILDMPEGMPRTRVFLSGNQLEGFSTTAPTDTPQGREIHLDLAGNLIDELPPSFWRSSGAIDMLSLSGNRLAQIIDFSDSPWPGLKDLDLSDNSITASSGLGGVNLPDLQALNLNANMLEALPESLLTLEALDDLDAGNNRLEGELPEWFAQLNLARLVLDNNRLSGPIARVFDAMDLDRFPLSGPHGDLGLILHIANNRFSGNSSQLPDIDFSAFNRPSEGQSPEFGLDLCFNNIGQLEDEQLENIGSVHRAMSLASCLGREQTAMDLSVSGSWYNPLREGEGLTQMVLDDGSLLSYWFTYGRQDDDEPPGQMWLFDVSEPRESWSESRPLLITSGGRFNHGLMGGDAQASRTWMRQNRLDHDSVHFFYDYRSDGLCITGACFWEVMSERFDIARLTQLAGTSCENQSPNQHLSGAWYSPERSGEGFIVEVLTDDRAVVYWFSYAPDESGKQVWMIGEGSFRPRDGDVDLPIGSESLVLEPMWQPIGAQFGPEFDPDAIEYIDWGRVVIDFHGDNTTDVTFDSNLDEYGSGSYSLERLASPKLAECD